MLKTILRAAAMLVSLAAPAVTSALADDAKDRCRGAGSGGSGGDPGRPTSKAASIAPSLMTGDQELARIYLQWLASRKGGRFPPS
jgi:hypothetical protein